MHSSKDFSLLTLPCFQYRQDGSATTTSATSGAALPTGTSTAKLHLLAQAAGKLYFGSATDNPELSDPTYVNLLSDSAMFGQITPGNSMKWDSTERSQGSFTFAGGDTVVALAHANGQLVRGHNCVWHNQLPSWVSGGTFTAAQLTNIVQTHCSVCPSNVFRYAWDVVNEPFNEDGTWRTDVFYNVLGAGYVTIALNAARSADPTAKLYLNDYNIEGSGAKATAMQNLVRSLKAAGTPIDGVGLQAHFIVGSVPPTLQTNIQAFIALGVEVAITELDIRMTLPATAALYNQQKTDYNTVISACKVLSGCIGVTIWDFTDKYSWVPNTFSGQGAACPWDVNFVKKPAYDGIVAGLS
ncbi:endo-1,4-beta xylanase [Vararia minispora EC-137]|uniref:Endo-1,4-beta xylanase n=1 Tax=Vararia minispora EC-137 TaxID=1314806 RepID=A0ACB8QRI2_9AGAM|nr:endo-1,4-beta xylanase [Vararia minispora EC-137]